MSDAPVDTLTVTIDGREITVPRGTLLIRAAEQLGIVVPRFCDHPLLDPVGACRQCMVEVEGMPKPMMACTTTVMPDMVVRTHLTSAVARKGQEGTLEFLLANHPLDCPMCDKGGECPLQDQALSHGSNVSRFVEQKRRYDKPVAISPQILLDRERCVLCARCTRFAEQIPGDPFIELFERSGLEQVAIFEDEPYESYFSGNVIQICPVGALTSTDYRFKARPFDVVTTPSVCGMCSAGCTNTIQSRRGEVQRQMARTNMAVNETWNCDKGRFGFAHLTAAGRLASPLVRDGGQLREASWSEALTRAVDALTAALADRGGEAGAGGRVAVLTGSRLADEDAYATAKFTRTVLGSDDVDFRTRFAPAGEDAALTALAGRGGGATYEHVEHAGVIVVAGLDPEEEVPILHLRLRKAWRNHKARIVVVGPHLGTLARLAWRHVPTAPGEEAAALRSLADRLAADVTPGAAPDRTGSPQTVEEDVVGALSTVPAPVMLVGERAGAGAIGAGASLAEAAGGRLAWVPRRSGARGAVDAGLFAGGLPGGRRLDDVADRREVEAVWGELPAEPGGDLRTILEDAAAGRIAVLYLIGIDLVRDAPSAELARAALAGAGLVIAQDLALTDTTELADVVLPVTARQERPGTSTNWEGRAQRFVRAIDGPQLAQDDWEILIQLAALLGRDLGFGDLDGIRREIAALGRRAVAHDLTTAGAPEPAGAGDVEPVGDGGFAVVARPLLLDRGTMLAGADDLLATARAATVTLSPGDAATLGLTDGDLVEVTGTGAAAPAGDLVLPVVVAADVVAGAVVLPTNSADVALSELAAPDGRLRVRLRRVDAAGQQVA